VYYEDKYDMTLFSFKPLDDTKIQLSKFLKWVVYYDFTFLTLVSV